MLTLGDNPFGSLPALIIENIKNGKANFTKLEKTNPLVGSRWLEALNLVKWMTNPDYTRRPNPD